MAKCNAHPYANAFYFCTGFLHPSILNYLTVLVHLQNTFKRYMKSRHSLVVPKRRFQHPKILEHRAKLGI